MKKPLEFIREYQRGDLFSWTGSPELSADFMQHPDVRLLLVERGSFQYLFNGIQLPVRKGDLFLYWGQTPHRIFEAAPDTLVWIVGLPNDLFFSWKIPQLSQVLLRGHLALQASGEEYGHDLRRFNQWQHDLWVKDYNFRRRALLEIEARLWRMEEGFAELPKPGAKPSASQAFSGSGLNKVEQMALYLSGAYRGPVRAVDLAGKVGLNVKYACELFHKTLGIGFKEYLTRCRLAHAERMMYQDQHNIAQIAMDSGFGSLSQFYAAYRKRHKTSPKRHYRLIQSRKK